VGIPIYLTGKISNKTLKLEMISGTVKKWRKRRNPLVFLSFKSMAVKSSSALLAYGSIFRRKFVFGVALVAHRHHVSFFWTHDNAYVAM
jgi:hypothetical protein